MRGNLERWAGKLHRRMLVSMVLCFGCLMLGGAMFGFLAGLRTPPEQREIPPKSYNVEVFHVERTDLQEVVTAFGTARSDREVVLSAQLAGEVVEIHPHLKVGKKVHSVGESQRVPGDLLVQIDRRVYQERFDQAQKRIAEDEAELEQVRQELKNSDRVLTKVSEDQALYQDEYDRILDLQKKGVAAASDLTRARLQLQQYETVRIRAENEHALLPLREEQVLSRKQTHLADLQLAELDLKHTEVRPPFSAVLSEVTVQQGQYVRAGDALVRLTSLQIVEIPVPLSLTDYAKIEARIRAGDKPRVVLAENETASGRWFGLLVRVAPVADESTRTVNAFIEVNNDEQDVPLLPGTFVHARINGPILSQVIVVPRDAMINNSLFVTRGDRAEERKVQVDRTLQSLAVVTSGLEHDDQVVLTNLDVIHDGAQVHIQQRRALAEELSRQRIRVARQVIAAEPAPAPADAVN